MAGGIYLVQEGGRLVEMAEQPYEVEAALQRLLADYPNLLAGDQIAPGSPRRWLLVAREVGVPDADGAADRWALDHLFLDQDAVPTLVEVKRSGDTRIRREVVGQMLDYAANAIVYWPLDEIKAKFEASCQLDGREPDAMIAALLNGDDDGATPDAGEFWQSAKRNLQAGRIRMIFVADEIPAELRRIVEFLNEQMDPAEVLAVEVRQFVGQGLRALVPTVVGQTVAAQQARAASGMATKRQWDETSFFEAIEARHGPAETAVARDILDWAKRTDLRIAWGKGAKDGSFYPMVGRSDGSEWTIGVFSNGKAEIEFGYLAQEHRHAQWHPFVPEVKRRELLDRLNAIPGVRLPEDAIAGWRSIPLATLAEPDVNRRFLDVLDWLVGELTAVPDASESAAE